MKRLFLLMKKLFFIVLTFLYVNTSLHAEDLQAIKEKMVLFLAVGKGSLAEVEKLLGQGYDPNVKNPIGGETPLQLAAREGKVEFIRLLVKKGAKVDEPSENGETALITGIHNLAVVTLLIDLGANVNHQGVFSSASRHAAGKKGFTPLHAAVAFSDPSVIRYLLAKGAKKNIPMYNGKNACELAAIQDKNKNQSEILRALGCDGPISKS